MYMHTIRTACQCCSGPVYVLTAQKKQPQNWQLRGFAMLRLCTTPWLCVSMVLFVCCRKTSSISYIQWVNWALQTNKMVVWTDTRTKLTPPKSKSVSIWANLFCILQRHYNDEIVSKHEHFSVLMWNLILMQHFVRVFFGSCLVGAWKPSTFGC